ncbi:MULTISPECIES: hypothetical protein [unclassified Streptomyces]|uniref:hypothetical protein n=1 Tax=unclassified Streptomyces TaxID=2593676 RepID=UPI00137080A6|nr:MULTISPECIES: hypothetical protein [unclassified Streptomyces]MYS23482.1 hypothetical protein [Streptomyces sp. SID4948]
MNGPFVSRERLVVVVVGNTLAVVSFATGDDTAATSGALSIAHGAAARLPGQNT